MAELLNIENNVVIRLEFNEKESLGKSDYESWVICTLELLICNMIKKKMILTMTLYEIEHLIFGIKDCIMKLDENRPYKFSFMNYEADFETSIDVVTEDEFFEIQIWFNIASYTKGKKWGYDDGVRFIADKKGMLSFYNMLLEEFRLLKNM